MEYAAKMCKMCGDYKPLDSFSKRKKSRDGLQSYCRKCYNTYRKEYYQKNKEREKMYVKSHRAVYTSAVKNWRKNHPNSSKAHGRIQMALKKGTIVKPKNCSNCGGIKRLHAHHYDYNYPYSVQWLCSECHRNLNKEKRNAAAN